MSFRPTVSVVNNGEVLTAYYCRNYTEWELLLTSASLARKLRRFRSSASIIKKLGVEGAQEFLDEYLAVSEFPVFVDLNAKVIYHADQVLSAREIKKRKELDLVSIVATRQKDHYGMGRFFEEDVVVPFHTTDLYKFFTSEDKEQVRRLLSIIQREPFEDLVRLNLEELSEKQKNERISLFVKTIDDLCKKPNYGVLRLKANLCMESERTFSWTLQDLVTCMHNLMDSLYPSKYAKLLDVDQNYPSVMEYADRCLKGNTWFPQNVKKTASIYEMLFDDCYQKFMDTVVNYHGYSNVLQGSVIGLFSYCAFFLGEMLLAKENESSLGEYVLMKHCPHLFDSYNFDERNYIGERHYYTDDLEETTYRYSCYFDYEYDPDKLKKEKEKNVRQLCAKLALEYYLKARFACEHFARQNAIVKQFKSVLNSRIASARRKLGYKAKLDECLITDPDKLTQTTHERIGDGFGAIRIIQGSNRSCEVFVEEKRRERNLRLSVYPELSFCTIESGVRFCVDQVNSIAVQDMKEYWIFDHFCIEESKDANGTEHVLLLFSWDGQTVVEIDATGPLIYRRGNYSPDLSDEDAENKILWKQLKLPPKESRGIPFKWGTLSSKEFFMQMPLEKLDLSVRTKSCLKRAGVKTLGDISALTIEKINGIRNFDEKSKHELYFFMKDKKLPFAYKVKEDDSAE